MADVLPTQDPRIQEPLRLTPVLPTRACITELFDAAFVGQDDKIQVTKGAFRALDRTV